MSVYLYDEAIINRLKQVLGKTEGINIINAEKVFTKSLEAQDNPVLPAVSLYRDKYALTTQTRNMALYRNTGRTEADAEDNLFKTRALPIQINYQVDIWTRTRQQNDEFTRDLIWFFTLYPEHKMTLRYQNFVRDIKFNTFLDADIINNSMVNEFEDKGQYYRSTLGLVVDEAQLFMVSGGEEATYQFEVIVESVISSQGDEV